jgi:signal transduction histidine kinase
VEVELSVTDRRFPTALEAAVFFVCSEGLANVVKHAAATRAVLSVAVDGRDLVARVSDDGCGGADRARGSGLRGLEDRVAALGGTFVVDSPSGGGSCLEARLPIPAA